MTEGASEGHGACVGRGMDHPIGSRRHPPRLAASRAARAVVFAGLFSASPLVAVESAATDAPAHVAPAEPASIQHTFALNPVFIPFGAVNAEYERALLTRFTSLGMSAQYEYRHSRARWFYAKMMFYPCRALHGFGLGLTAGLTRAYRDPEDIQKMPQDTAASVGFIAQYNLLFGPRDLVLVGLGGGGRVALQEDFARSPLRRFDAEARIVLGVAF